MPYANSEKRKEHDRLYKKEYRKTHKKELSNCSKIRCQKLSYRFSQFLRTSKFRKIEITISFLEWLELILCDICYYCGGNLDNAGNSLDRIDSSKGYIPGNVRPCCKKCNWSKSNQSEADFRNWIIHIYNHWAAGKS
jgi:hypothetical protein